MSLPHPGGEATLAPAATLIPVLVYHSVAEEPPAGQIRRYTVTPARFREQLDVIAAGGFTAITISELASALRGLSALPERPLGITFDDGFEDTLAAVERLSARGLSSTVYVTSGTVDTVEGISTAGLRALAEMNCELGAHSVSHPHLDELPLAQAAREIGDSREQLEHHLGRAIATFAYPHGAHNREIRELVVEAGYSSAAACKNALSHSGDDPFAIARWIVTYPTTDDGLARVLAGTGAPIAWARERHRTRASRAARRLRRRMRTLRAGDGPGAALM